MAEHYTADSLETAACLWEGVLDIFGGGAGQKGLRAQAQRIRENIGTSELRSIVISWTHAVEEDWSRVDRDKYQEPFDWEWIPEWISRNVDWSGARPELRSKRFVPGVSA